jgi:pimeloyl-ACP methyl ester carboxylesterase
MNDSTILLLHGMATGSASWGPIAKSLVASGNVVLAPDLLGYGKAPPPSDAYEVSEEVSYLIDWLDQQDARRFHIVAHSQGAMIGLHLRRALPSRVTAMTLIEPVIVSVLREAGEEAAYAEMEGQYHRFMNPTAQNEAVARTFVDHWSGPGAWQAMGAGGRAMVMSLLPKIRLEMVAVRLDVTTLAWLAEGPVPPTAIMIGARTLLAPRATACRLAPALAAKTIEVAGAAHMIPLTHAQAVIDVFLRQRQAASTMTSVAEE